MQKYIMVLCISDNSEKGPGQGQVLASDRGRRGLWCNSDCFPEPASQRSQSSQWQTVGITAVSVERHNSLAYAV